MVVREETDLVEVLGSIGGLAEPVKTPFLKALNNLLGGLTAIPAAKLKTRPQRAQ